MPPIRISLVTPSFNQGRFIGRTIESVLSQRGEFELEYVVLDGGSSDETIDVLRSYGDRLRWRSQPDGGQVEAVNEGLRAATGDIVGWLNSDDVLAPGALARVARAFSANRRLEWLHGRCSVIDADDREIRRWISAYKHWRATRYSYDGLIAENFVSQMTVFWRRHLLEETGYLDPRVDLAFDYDFWLRLAKRSDPLYIPDLQASFRWYETTKSGSAFVEQSRQDYAVAARHATGRRWPLWFKRLLNWRIVVTYRLMGLLRRGAGAGP